MDLKTIKTLIDFVGRSNVRELSVSKGDCTVRIFKSADQDISVDPQDAAPEAVSHPAPQGGDDHAPTTTQVKAPIFGVLHRASAPGEPPFVTIGDVVEEGQTLFIIEAMKVFNKIAAPKAGRISHLTQTDGAEVETNELLAEIA